MVIKVIALDIYGTVLASEDAENLLPPRKGLEGFFRKCGDKRIKVVGASDADLINLKIDLKESGVNVEAFDRFYELKQTPKDFSKIIKDYKINAEELLVIGDSDKDIDGARNSGACHFKVIQYHDSLRGADFSLKEIDF